MALYSYEALAQDGELLRGVMEAPDQGAVVARLRLAGRIPLEARPAKTNALRLRAHSARMPRRERALFTRELAALVHAGLPVDRALQVVAEVSAQGSARRLALDLRREVEAGCALSEALEAHPGTFDRFYVNMVRAAEAGGTLGPGLSRLAGYEEKSRATRDAVISALIYPGVLVTVACAALLLLLGYVVPQFAPLFADAGSALPLSTRIVMGGAELLLGFWPVGLAALAGAALMAHRSRHEALVLRLPLAGELVRRMETARLCRSLATLLASGVPLLSAIGIASEIVSNRVLADALKTAGEELKGGTRLAAALLGTGAFPGMAIQLIKVGEESGRLQEMLERVAEIYDAGAAAAMQRLLVVLEPALIVLAGALIGGVILSVFAAIVSVNDLPL